MALARAVMEHTSLVQLVCKTLLAVFHLLHQSVITNLGHGDLTIKSFCLLGWLGLGQLLFYKIKIIVPFLPIGCQFLFKEGLDHTDGGQGLFLFDAAHDGDHGVEAVFDQVFEAGDRLVHPLIGRDPVVLKKLHHGQ